MKIKKPMYLLCVLMMLSNIANAQYYRYKDVDGNLIISNTMDSESSRLGYEIIDAKGKVIKVIAPEATNEQQQAIIDAKKRDAEQKQFDLSLLRKYSFVADIEAEKKRKMAELQATLSIVKGNLTSTRSELEELYSSAAAIERQGKPIPDDLKKKIKDVESVVIGTEDLYKLREAEMQKSSEDYDAAIKRFQEIQVLRGRK
jgi:ribosome recycling factor